jgi:hypothetical protein
MPDRLEGGFAILTSIRRYSVQNSPRYGTCGNRGSDRKGSRRPRWPSNLIRSVAYSNQFINCAVAIRKRGATEQRSTLLSEVISGPVEPLTKRLSDCVKDEKKVARSPYLA